MNPSILTSEVQQFLKENAKVTPAQMALKKSPFVDVGSSELAGQIDSYQRLRSKLPTWTASANIYYPPRQNAEQCSSEATAKYKASLVSGKKAIDLTGGFGVDVWALSQRFEQVDYCEMNEQLYPIVAHNFKRLGCENVTCHLGDGVEFLLKSDGGSKPPGFNLYDLIYLDPARRDEHNRKMVSFADCVPNVVELQDTFFEHSEKAMIKASPMMDVSLALDELKYVKEVHVVALKNECKELLFLMEKDFEGEPEIICVNLPAKGSFSFKRSEELTSQASFLLPDNYLFEPDTAVLKAGAFNVMAEKMNLKKLHPSTHLYTSDSRCSGFPGKTYEVKSNVEYNKKKIIPLLSEKKANIKTYNFSNTPQQVKKKLGLKDGGDTFLFGVKTVDDKFRVLLCEQI